MFGRRGVAAGLLALALAGCGVRGVLPIAPGEDPAVESLFASGQAGGGSITLALSAADGVDQAVQFLPRARKASDIKAYRFELLDAASGEARAMLDPESVKAAYQIRNIPVLLKDGDLIKVRVQAFADVTRRVGITKDPQGVVSTPIRVKDQQSTSVSIRLELADGATANGDIDATIIVVDGKETVPMPRID